MVSRAEAARRAARGIRQVQRRLIVSRQSRGWRGDADTAEAPGRFTSLVWLVGLDRIWQDDLSEYVLARATCSPMDEDFNLVSTDTSTAPGPVAATTFPQLIRAAAAAYGDDPAIVLKADSIPDDAASFGELDARSAQLAKGLIARGVGKGHRIGFIYGNSPQFAVILAAIARIGAIAVPISTLIKSNELVRVLRQSDVGGLIVQRSLLRHDYAERLCEAMPGLREQTSPDLRLPEAPYLRWIVSGGDGLPSGIADLAWLTDAAATVGDDLLVAVESEVHPTDQMIEIYTSGSMALPKGVKHCHGPAMFRAQYLTRMTNVTRGKEISAFLPMFWIGGLMMYLLPGWAGGAVTMCTEGTSTSNRMAMGSVMAEDDMAAMKQQPPFWGLGMTETLGPYTFGDEVRAKGFPLCAPMDHIADRYEVRIADENDNPVAEGERGEMQVRGYALSPGLHKVERDAYYTPDGYYHTGDMCLVEGSRILFVGRDGDMIKTASSNVSPAEVEMELQSLPAVHVAYVVGLPDQERGQLVVAGVIPREGESLDFAAIEAELRGRLSGFKVPRAFVELAHADVPMLHSNKVSRRQIEKLLAEDSAARFDRAAKMRLEFAPPLLRQGADQEIRHETASLGRRRSVRLCRLQVFDRQEGRWRSCFRFSRSRAGRSQRRRHGEESCQTCARQTSQGTAGQGDCEVASH